MTGQIPGHAGFDELAAGYAVHALEPADEQRFLRHAEQCPCCQQSAADFQEVATALAETAPPAQPGTGLSETILAAALADPDRQEARHQETRGTAGEGGTVAPGDAVSSRVVPLRRRPGRRWQRPAAAAAAAALIAVGVSGPAWGWPRAVRGRCWRRVRTRTAACRWC